MMAKDAVMSLALVLELTELLSQDISLDTFLAEVQRTALELLPAATHASLRLLDDRGAQLVGGDAAVPRARSFGVWGWVLRERRGVRIDDAKQDPRFVPPSGEEPQVRSLIAEPIHSGAQVIGVLAVSSPRLAAFGDVDQLLVRLLAHCSAPAIERDRLQRLTLLDPLTQTYNLGAMLPRISEEIERAKRDNLPFSVILFDLDHFKKVNDEHGHAVGDQVLVAVVERIREQKRQMDILVRRGGEEFVLLLPGVAELAAARMAERLRAALGQSPLQLSSGLSLRQTISLGVAQWRAEEDAEELADRADRAMYQAKRLGRDRVCLASELP